MSLRVCSTPGCPNLTNTPGNCPQHQRGTANQRGYTSKGHQQFRYAVLARDPICVLCRAARSTDADHHPRERTELIRLGLNPNNPDYGRGLCHRCHTIATNQRDQ